MYQANSNLSYRNSIYIAPLATTGLFAALGIPTFNKVRITSQENTVRSNLRILANAAAAYFLENPKAVAVTPQTLVENGYSVAFDSVIGETYPGSIQANFSYVQAVLPDGRVFAWPEQYSMTLDGAKSMRESYTEDGLTKIYNNLRLISRGAKLYFLKNPKKRNVTLHTLLNEGYIKNAIESIYGEVYNFTIPYDSTQLKVMLPDGSSVTFPKVY